MLRTLAESLDRLTPEMQPLWGRMTPQHMVEHLADTFGVSTERIVLPLVSSEERVPKLRAIMLGSRPFPREFIHPLIPDLPALRLPDLASARRELLEAIEEYYRFFEESPEASPVNPVFGPLTRDEWGRFHEKHMTHHFQQFGLL